MKGYILTICFFMTATIAYTYQNLQYRGVPRTTSCSGECFAEYVRINGTPAEIERKKQALAQADEFSNIRSLWAGCAACHGADGGGGIGPMLAGQNAEDIISKLTIYKNRGQIGAQSALMWGQAGMLTEDEISTIGKFIQGGMPK